MKKSRLLGAVCVCALCFNSLTVHAVAVSGQGTWESTLQGRDLDGNLSTFEAYYDTVQDITWLADANYAQTSGFHASGRMTFFTAKSWAAGLNINGITGWRLPVTGASSSLPGDPCDDSEGFNCTESEMGHMYYNVLGNTAGSLTNTGPFSNLHSSGYWSATRPLVNFRFSWTFNFGNGFQRLKDNTEFFPPVVTQNAWVVHSGDVGVPVEIITIDIKPGSGPNSINLKSKGMIPVAILTTDTFDATQVNWETVLFGPDGTSESHGRSHVKDVDDDGDADVVLHFRTPETGIRCGDTEATLTGETFDGQAFTGSDAISTVRCPEPEGVTYDFTQTFGNISVSGTLTFDGSVPGSVTVDDLNTLATWDLSFSIIVPDRVFPLEPFTLSDSDSSWATELIPGTSVQIDATATELVFDLTTPFATNAAVVLMSDGPDFRQFRFGQVNQPGFVGNQIGIQGIDIAAEFSPLPFDAALAIMAVSAGSAP